MYLKSDCIDGPTQKKFFLTYTGAKAIHVRYGIKCFTFALFLGGIIQ